MKKQVKEQSKKQADVERRKAWFKGEIQLKRVMVEGEMNLSSEI